MDTHDETSTRDADGAIGRRRLLQGAVAAGVGAVAWTSPSISSLGGTPAYAAVCTGGYEDFVIDYRNTACNCGSPPNEKLVSYKDPYNTQQCPVANNAPRQVTFHQGNLATSPLLTNSGSCPPTTPGGPGAYAWIQDKDAPNDYQFCRLKVESVEGNCSTGSLVVKEYAYSDIVPKDANQFVPMPNVSCKADGNIFLRISLECANEIECLPVYPTP